MNKEQLLEGKKLSLMIERLEHYQKRGIEEQRKTQWLAEMVVEFEEIMAIDGVFTLLFNQLGKHLAIHRELFAAL